MTTQPHPAINPADELGQVLTAINRGQRCDTTGMYPDECGCNEHYQDRPTVISAAALERLTNHPLPAYRMKRREPEWVVPDPKAVRCIHRKDDLCGDCETLLTDLLTDLPTMIEHLGAAVWKDVRFAPRGVKAGDKDTSEESPIPFNPTAFEALKQLKAIMADGRTMDRHILLVDLSRAMRRGHRVIDVPTEHPFTVCPKCRNEIPVVSKKLAVHCGSKIVEDDPDSPEPSDGEPRKQRTRTCDYEAVWDQHYRDLMDVNMDAALTMSDLLLIFGGAGEKMDRNRMNYLIDRHGLPREKMKRVTWRAGKPESKDMWVYRLRDVLDFQQALTRKATS